MYAVIRTGGKQYRVAPEDIIEIEKVAGAAGEIVEFADVLMVGGNGSLELGTPTVAGACVAGEVLEQKRGAKILVFKKKRRKNYRRKRGHRQHLTAVRITEILTGGKKPSKAAAKPAAKPKDEAKPKAAAKSKEPAKAAPETKKEAPKKEPAKKAAAKARAFESLKKPEGEADDLKKISGVGPKLEEKLNGLGIFHYWQVAGFTKDDIAKVDDELNFKGRIERDDWVGQAKTLMKG